MPKYFILFIALIYTQFSFAQDKKPLITFHSSTDCFECGDWGLPFFKKLLDEYSDNSVVLLNLQNEGGLSNSLSEDLSSNFNSSTPMFFFNGEKLEINKFNQDEKFEKIKTLVDSFKTYHPLLLDFVLEEPQENFPQLIQASISTDEPFNIIDKDTYASFYFVENYVEHAQEGAGLVHHRKLIFPWEIDPFGTLFFESGDILLEGTSYNIQLAGLNTDDSNPIDYTNFEIAIVFWEKNEDYFRPVQADILSLGSQFSTLEDSNLLENYSLYLDEGNQLKFNSHLNTREINISVLNQSGQNIFQKNHVVFNNSINFNYDFKEHPVGLYYLHIRCANGTTTLPFFKSN